MFPQAPKLTARWTDRLPLLGTRICCEALAPGFDQNSWQAFWRNLEVWCRVKSCRPGMGSRARA